MRQWIVFLAVNCLLVASVPLIAGSGVLVTGYDSGHQTALPVQVNVSTAPIAGQYSSTARVSVQRVAQLRRLTVSECRAIDQYLYKYWQISAHNRQSLRAALEFLVAIDQSHVPLTRKPAQYFADYQTFTQLYNRTDWYANVPQYRLPAFTPSQDCGSVQAPSLCLDFEAGECKIVTATCPPEAYRFGSQGDREEALIGGFSFGEREIKEKEKPPPPSPVTCPPGEAPAPPAPNSPAVNEPGNPSGPIIDPPAADPNRPPDQVDHGTSGQPWDPQPDSPPVADPVN